MISIFLLSSLAYLAVTFSVTLAKPLLPSTVTLGLVAPSYLLLKIKSELFGNVMLIVLPANEPATFSSIVISAIEPYPSTEMFLASPAVATNTLSVTTSAPVKEYLPDVANES